MNHAPRILAVITARGGSKRLPGKNIRPLAGKPLLAWTIDAAKQSAVAFHSIVLSTDDAAIAEVGRAYGAEVPFIRSGELASDMAASLPVVQHATRFIEERDGVAMDWVMLLQPTSPLRNAEDIRAVVELSKTADVDSIVSVSEMPVHPVFAKKLNAQGLLEPFGETVPEGLRRQDASPAAYCYNGAVYLTRRDVLMQQDSFYGARCLPHVMPPARAVDIDTLQDFQLAEAMLAKLSDVQL